VTELDDKATSDELVVTTGAVSEELETLETGFEIFSLEEDGVSPGWTCDPATLDEEMAPVFGAAGKEVASSPQPANMQSPTKRALTTHLAEIFFIFIKILIY
jgi:hypothetical protein